ncbi:hypothetical protein C8R43DRAFT_991215 [Mycena crocata]|nr:hypothetical protein C8R43DRAFT_991215 [Mycena crocata]
MPAAFVQTVPLWLLDLSSATSRRSTNHRLSPRARSAANTATVQNPAICRTRRSGHCIPATPSSRPTMRSEDPTKTTRTSLA